MKTQLLILMIVLLAGAARATMGAPEEIPNAGHIRIDGQLSDWRNAEWTPLTQTLGGNPKNISNAEWSLQWNDDPVIYIAIRYNDDDLVLGTGLSESSLPDCVTIYVRGDNGSEPLDYSKTQASAQQYIFGLSPDKTTAWKQLAGADTFPAHNPAEVAVTLDGTSLIYEIKVPLYDWFSIENKNECETTEVMEDLEVGVDIGIVDVGKTGFAGICSENRMGGKSRNADQIALHTLGE